MPLGPDDVDQANSQKTHDPPQGPGLLDLQTRAPRVDRKRADCRRELGQHQLEIQRLERRRFSRARQRRLEGRIFGGAPVPLMGAGLPGLAIGIGYGVYWLVRRRRNVG